MITAEEPVAPDVGYVTNETLENESLSFDTTAVGQPHWVKISYFPNWHVKGAEGPYLASPSMMMVIPTESHVTLYYGRTAANTVGQTLEVLAWVLLLCLTGWRTVLWFRRRRLEGAVQGSDVILGTGPLEAEPDEYDQFVDLGGPGDVDEPGLDSDGGENGEPKGYRCRGDAHRALTSRRHSSAACQVPTRRSTGCGPGGC